MAAITPPTITALPAPPNPDDRSTFNTLAYPWSVAVGDMTAEIDAVAANVYANAVSAQDQVTLASGQVTLATAQADSAANSAMIAQGAASTAGSIAWVSGTTYAVGDIRYSPIDFLTYRRKTAGAGTTDPSADGTNWIRLSNNTVANVVVNTVSGSWTCPDSVSRAKIIVVGGGASAETGSGAHYGAGAGGTAIAYRNVTPGATYTIVVGAGGAAVSTNTTAGNNGGTSSFEGADVPIISATGGYASGGGGGIGSGGDINLNAIPTFIAPDGSGRSVPGGSSFFGGGASPTGGSGGFGGGGAGIYGASTNPAGNDGVVIIEY